MAYSGSLCTGGGLLDRAVEELFGVTAAWQAESDKAASQVLAKHWPGVPNLGDITRINWKTVTPVDLLAGGIPCTPFSGAGPQLGSADERHLWPTGMLPAITALLPSVVVFENVPRLLTIENGAVFATILTDLDRLGYTVAWTVMGACKMGACKMGACHHRHRLFMLAVQSPQVKRPATPAAAARAGDVWLPVQRVLFGDVQAVRWPASALMDGGLLWPLPVQTCGDTQGVLLPTPAGRDATRGGGSLEPEGRPLSEAVALLPQDADGLARFGRYAAAVARQERLFGGPVPAPTEPNRIGNPRLTGAFPEWMQAAPAGFLTGVVDRENAVRIAGNGVFGPVVGYALRTLPTFPAAVALLSRERLGVAA